MKLTYIYAHVEPLENEIFYVGKADDPWGRLAGHLRDAKTATHYQANKLRKLAAQELKPRVEIIAEVPVEEWEFWERHYIKYFRDLGFRLTNATDGGDGGPTRIGHKFTPEHCAKLSAALTGKSKSPEHRSNLSKAKLGKLAPPNVLLVLQANGRATKGVKRPPEFGTAVSAGKKGKKFSPEHCKNMGLARLGKPLSAAHCAALSVAQSGENNGFFGKRHSPSALAKMRAAKLGKKRK